MRAPRGQRQLIAVCRVQFDLRAFGQFAHDFIQSVLGRRDRAATYDFRRTHCDESQIRIDRFDTDRLAYGADQVIR